MLQRSPLATNPSENWVQNIDSFMFKCLNKQAPEYVQNLLVEKPTHRSGLRSELTYKKLLISFMKRNIFVHWSLFCEWKEKEVPLNTEVKLLQTLVFPIVCYVCETWKLKADVTHRLEAFEMHCYHHLLNIKWQNHITNADVQTGLGSFIKMWFCPQSGSARQSGWSMWHICLQISCQILACLVMYQESFIAVIVLRDGLKIFDLI